MEWRGGRRGGEKSEGSGGERGEGRGVEWGISRTVVLGEGHQPVVGDEEVLPVLGRLLVVRKITSSGTARTQQHSWSRHGHGHGHGYGHGHGHGHTLVLHKRTKRNESARSGVAGGSDTDLNRRAKNFFSVSRESLRARGKPNREGRKPNREVTRSQGHEVTRSRGQRQEVTRSRGQTETQRLID